MKTLSNPIAADAWANGRWKVQHDEFPWGDLELCWSRSNPCRCLWCGRELRSNVTALRRAFVAAHSHDEFPILPEHLMAGRPEMVTADTDIEIQVDQYELVYVDIDLIDPNPWQPRQYIDHEPSADADPSPTVKSLAENMALVGLLRVLDESRPDWHSRASWTVDDPPLRPCLHVPR